MGSMVAPTYETLDIRVFRRAHVRNKYTGKGAQLWSIYNRELEKIFQVDDCYNLAIVS